jgi:hypothetical protein
MRFGAAAKGSDWICKKYRVAASLIVLLMWFDASRRVDVITEHFE